MLGCRYGDHLYDKGEFESAMRCYMKTIGEVQASYVIRKVSAFCLVCTHAG